MELDIDLVSSRTSPSLLSLLNVFLGSVGQRKAEAWVMVTVQRFGLGRENGKFMAGTGSLPGCGLGCGQDG